MIDKSVDFLTKQYQSSVVAAVSIPITGARDDRDYEMAELVLNSPLGIDMGVNESGCQIRLIEAGFENLHDFIMLPPPPD